MKSNILIVMSLICGIYSSSDFSGPLGKARYLFKDYKGECIKEVANWFAWDKCIKKYWSKLIEKKPQGTIQDDTIPSENKNRYYERDCNANEKCSFNNSNGIQSCTCKYEYREPALPGRGGMGGNWD